jgi:ABC-type sulfate/molybdate transport systems ATPase subunit
VKPVVMRELAVALGGRTVLGPLELELEERTWTLVVGPSGCGKTTLLRVIAGLVAPSAGELELDGRVASRAGRIVVPPEARRIGMVFQGAGAGLWPHLSACRTLELVLAWRGTPRARRRARATELLELVELRGLDTRRPAELSGGEAQRLALARALAVEPRLLLLDEPLGALDHALRTALAARLAELHRRLGTTLLQATHDPGEIAAYADRVLSLEDGRIRGDERRALR